MKSIDAASAVVHWRSDPEWHMGDDEHLDLHDWMVPGWVGVQWWLAAGRPGHEADEGGGGRSVLGLLCRAREREN